MSDKKKKQKKPERESSGKGLRQYINFNIGTVIFGALFLYLIITVVIYVTADHVVSYQVTRGPLSQNETYTALVKRSEEVVTADTAGFVNYFVQDGSKVSKNSTVCSITSTQFPMSGEEAEEQDLSELRRQASIYSGAFDANDFRSVYDFKYKLKGTALAQANTATLSGALCSAPADGVVAYSCDGYENLNTEDLTAEDFQSRSYRQQNLSGNTQAAVSDPVYRLITSEKWSLIIPVTDAQTVSLAAHDQIQVKFLKDGQSETGSLRLFTSNEQRYVEITFDSGMVRYCNDRFLEVELVTNTRSGLKIPLSSIVTKDFYLIPAEWAVTGGENGELGFLKEITDENGQTGTSFVQTTIYAETTSEEGGSFYYADMNSLAEGDVLVRPDSNSCYTVGETGSLEGVYSINGGYAVFRRVSIIDQNDEYCIVETGTDYGIAAFDYIVYDGNSVKEDDILY